jgi:pimeloyl-ACP methyl ester carboxylesterase
MTATVLFLHGLEGRPTGTKATTLQQAGFDLVAPSLPADDFAASVRIAQDAFDAHRPAVVVGSSRGGAVALSLAPHHAAVVLVCPAWKKFAPGAKATARTRILHSAQDELIPLAESQELATYSGLSPDAVTVVGTAHRMSDPAALEALVEAVRDAQTRTS